MASVFRERLRAAFALPHYLAAPFSGVDVSTSGVKSVRLAKDIRGFVLAEYSQVRLPTGAFDGDVIDHATIVKAVTAATKEIGVTSANAALAESKSYLFETTVPGNKKTEWRTSIEQRLEELVPLPPSETAFDIISLNQKSKEGEESVVGIGFARRIVDGMLAVFDEAQISVRALEEETFAMARALLPVGDTSTVLIIDVGKTTTKMAIVSHCIPRFATTFNIGGHSLTLAVQKYFGVTEAEARKVKAEHGIVPAPGNEEYIAAMLSTVSAIRDEISRRLEYWQGKGVLAEGREKVSRVILSGGYVSVRGFPEYLEGALKIPVVTGDVFTNFASRDVWIPPLEYSESLAYATAIGLALRDATDSYA
ncbi:MAG: pilus assembly protein PilM [bacterium]|nr:pilus assembly protein PilM [bacterium]